MSYNSNVPATELLNALTADADFTIPALDLSDTQYQFPGDINSDLYKPVARVTDAQVTTGTIDGTGSFDTFMCAMNAHLRKEYDGGRITGSEYTKAYISLTQAAMGAAIQFVLGRDAAYWQAQSAQIQAITARVALETAKVQAAQVKIAALTEKASYALTVTKLATEDATFSNAKFQRDELLPAQKNMIQEQAEAQRGQTLNNRSDGAVITGTIGKQKELHAQQITSYQRDSEIKAGKLFVDAWITQKTIDEAVLPPNGFTNASLDTVLTAIKANNNLD